MHKFNISDIYGNNENIEADGISTGPDSVVFYTLDDKDYKHVNVAYNNRIWTVIRKHKEEK